MGSEAGLIWSVFFGAIGIGFFVYGRRQRRVVPFVSGLALMGVPYFVDSVGAMIALCVAFIALPYFVRR